MQKRRLLKLADFLETVPPEQFDMSTWQAGDEEKWDCKTAGCAVGWAAQIPSFKQAGLTLRNGSPQYREADDSWEAVETFFGLSMYEEGEYLFSAEEYASQVGYGPLGVVKPIPPTMVAERIREFVKTGTIA